MRKILSTFCLVLGFAFPAFCAEPFENVPAEYCISFGDPQAKTKLVEYFSLSCPKCITILKRDFPHFREKYIDTDEVFWVMHPDPADILTLQLMECLGALSEKEKRAFFEHLIVNFPSRPSKQIVFEMQKVLADWGRPLPHLHDLNFLETTKAFQVAFSYVQQENAPKEIPTISINGEMKSSFPTHSFVEKEIERALEKAKELRQGEEN